MIWNQLTPQEKEIIVQDIILSLPVSHYLKRGTIKPTAGYSDTSYYDPENDKIVVSIKNIETLLKNTQKMNQDITSDELEKIIRGLCYHELGHAIMTPIMLMIDMPYRGVEREFTNIIEDERMETILKDTFKNVNFKENFKNLCYEHIPQVMFKILPYETFLFYSVRFREPPYAKDEILNELEKFIAKNKTFTQSKGRMTYNEMPSYEYESFLGDIKNLNDFIKSKYDEFALPKDEGGQSQQQQQQQGEGEQTQSQESQENQESQESQEQQKEGGQQQEQPQEDSQEDSKEQQETPSQEHLQDEVGQTQEHQEIPSNEFTQDEVNEIIENEMQRKDELLKKYRPTSPTFETAFKKILLKSEGVGIKDSHIQYGYSGKFNAKRFMKDFNDERKWFEKKSFNENIAGKKGDTKVLNIFLDNSSSFRDNDLKVNQILRSMMEMEKKFTSFHFNLVRFGSKYGEYLMEGNQRLSYSMWGTRLTASIKQTFKKLNPTGKEVNIFLLDGSIQAGKRYVATFNNNKTIAIIDESTYEHNLQPDGLLNRCKSVITASEGEYAEKLEENIINALNLLY